MREAPVPEPQPGEVRIRVAYAGINFADILARRRRYPDAPPPPCVVGYEVSGTVDAVGADVERSLKGRRVLAATRFGGYSEYVCVPASMVFPTPDGVGDAEAAALLVTYLTAHHMIVRMANVQPSETVLLHGAAGGVGTAAVQLLRLRGARIIGTASPAKHEFLRAQGVEPVDYRERRWPDRVRRLTGGRGVDVAFDAVGGHSFRQSYRLLAPGGRLCCYGNSAMLSNGRSSLFALAASILRMPWFHPIPLMNENRGVLGVNIGHLWKEETLLKPQVEALLSYLAQRKIAPIVDRVFRFDEAAAAHRYIEERRNVGKVLLAP